MKYPRCCPSCERFYKSPVTFCQHKKKCKEYTAEKQNKTEQKSIADVKTTIISGSAAVVFDLQNELDVVKRELECLKLKHEISQRKVPIGYSTGDTIYLAQTRDCFDKDNNVFKIGRTTNYEKRKTGYPKGTIFFLARLCLHAPAMERTILAKAETLYQKRTDYGNEYFEGDLHSMIDLINTEVNAVSIKE